MKIKPIYLKTLYFKGFPFSWVEQDGVVIRACFCDGQKLKGAFPWAVEGKGGVVEEMLNLYFSGGRVTLQEVPLRQEGSDFQRKVWARVKKIPYGEVLTYGALAQELSTSPRAVARALASNRWPLFIPCHRVVGKRGLGGFTPDVKIKRTLLELEGGWHDKNG